jgi:hypothetical protein
MGHAGVDIGKLVGRAIVKAFGRQTDFVQIWDRRKTKIAERSVKPKSDRSATCVQSAKA